MNHPELIAEIESLEKQLSAKYNCGVTLHVSIQKYSLQDIKNATNKVFKSYWSQTDCIENKKREQMNVVFRSIYYTLALECNHTLEAMGEYINKNHATAHNGIKKLKARLQKEYSPVRDYYNKVKQELELAKQ